MNFQSLIEALDTPPEFRAELLAIFQLSPEEAAARLQKLANEIVAHRKRYQTRTLLQRTRSILWGKEIAESIRKYRTEGFLPKTAASLAYADFRHAYPWNEDAAANQPGHSGPTLRRYVKTYRDSIKQ